MTDKINISKIRDSGLDAQAYQREDIIHTLISLFGYETIPAYSTTAEIIRRLDKAAPGLYRVGIGAEIILLVSNPKD